MIIHTLPSGPFDTNAYLIACPATHLGAVIDPGVDSIEKIEKHLSGIKLDKIILTHSHWDHIGDAAALKLKYNLPIYIHPLDAPNLIKPGADLLPCWLPIKGVEPDILIEDGMEIELGNLRFKVLHTPGHSPGGVCLYCEKENILFAGDTLFKGSFGNLSFPTSQPEKMWHSLDRLAKLPAKTVAYPGHGPKTTIGEEGWLPNAKQIFS